VEHEGAIDQSQRSWSLCVTGSVGLVPHRSISDLTASSKLFSAYTLPHTRIAALVVSAAGV
jgi:hypothetical protein